MYDLCTCLTCCDLFWIYACQQVSAIGLMGAKRVDVRCMRPQYVTEADDILTVGAITPCLLANHKVRKDCCSHCVNIQEQLYEWAGVKPFRKFH